MNNRDFDQQHIWHPYAAMPNALPVYPVRSAHGCIIELADGRKLIDGMSSWWAALHGYNHPRLNAAAQAQLQQMSHIMFGGLTHEPAARLAERLVGILPSGLDKIFFADSGSVAVEVAMKMALQYQQAKGLANKHQFAAIRAGYHGDTWHAMSVCDPETGMHGLFRRSLPVQYFLPQPESRFHEPWSPDSARALETLFAEQADNLAALILEPIVQGAGGMYFYHPEYLRHARRLCDQHGVLLIFDEIAVGCGRTGRLFAHEHAGVRPDLLCLSKGITGGTLPLAVVLTTDEVFEAFLDERIERGFLHSHSYTGNPLACRAACATLALLEEPGIPERLEALGAAFERALAPIAAQHGAAHLRRCGTLVAFDLPKAAEDFPRRAAVAALEHGLLLRPLGRTVYVMPPYETRPEEVDFACEAIVRTLADVL